MEPWILEIIFIVVGTVIMAPILWFVGRAFVGREKAKFTDALWIMLLGQVINRLFIWGFSNIFESLIASIIAFIIQLLIWLYLIKHFFDTGWGKAFIIALIAVIVSVIVFAIIGMILIAIGLMSILF